jgi:hypothetical protein
LLRLFIRGIDDNGCVANYVETEQILQLNDVSCSYVQVNIYIDTYSQAWVFGISMERSTPDSSHHPHSHHWHGTNRGDTVVLRMCRACIFLVIEIFVLYRCATIVLLFLAPIVIVHFVSIVFYRQSLTSKLMLMFVAQKNHSFVYLYTIAVKKVFNQVCSLDTSMLCLLWKCISRKQVVWFVTVSLAEVSEILVLVVRVLRVLALGSSVRVLGFEKVRTCPPLLIIYLFHTWLDKAI